MEVEIPQEFVAEFALVPASEWEGRLQEIARRLKHGIGPNEVVHELIVDRRWSDLPISAEFVVWLVKVVSRLGPSVKLVTGAAPELIFAPPTAESGGSLGPVAEQVHQAGDQPKGAPSSESSKEVAIPIEFATEFDMVAAGSFVDLLKRISGLLGRGFSLDAVVAELMATPQPDRAGVSVAFMNWMVRTVARHGLPLTFVLPSTPPPPADSWNAGGAATLNVRCVAMLSRRYRDAYQVSRTTIGAGDFLQGVGAALAVLLTIAMAVVANVAQELARVGVIIAGLTAAAIAYFVFHVLAVIVRAQGQQLLAQLDVAVQASSFLSDADKLDIIYRQ